MKKVISIIFIIIGVLLICYPLIGSILFKINQTSVIGNFKEKIVEMDEKEVQEIKEKYTNNQIDNTGEMIGYIEIEKIGVYLPIYEGTTDKILLKGIGHLESTDLPVINKEYNSVFIGHTGITGKILFDDLISLEINDNFVITILDTSCNYKIYDIKTLLPDKVTDFLIDSENNKKNTVTLITCTPKYVNSHRLLVMGAAE